MNEASAVGSVRLLVNCAVLYRSDHPAAGYPPAITSIGPVSGGGDGCLDEVITNATNGGPPKSYYTFTYTAGEPNEEGVVETFTITARPSHYQRNGCYSFFHDETGILRRTFEDRQPTRADPPLP